MKIKRLGTVGRVRIFVRNYWDFWESRRSLLVLEMEDKHDRREFIVGFLGFHLCFSYSKTTTRKHGTA